jgi:hypothetical protein|tara:strand:+ start:1663 stop:1878 length:216 start_codon:yes stop_codon:yes gene_type:complete
VLTSIGPNEPKTGKTKSPLLLNIADYNKFVENWRAIDYLGLQGATRGDTPPDFAPLKLRFSLSPLYSFPFL